MSLLRVQLLVRSVHDICITLLNYLTEVQQFSTPLKSHNTADDYLGWSGKQSGTTVFTHSILLLC